MLMLANIKVVGSKLNKRSKLLVLLILCSISPTLSEKDYSLPEHSINSGTEGNTENGNKSIPTVDDKSPSLDITTLVNVTTGITPNFNEKEIDRDIVKNESLVEESRVVNNRRRLASITGLPENEVSISKPTRMNHQTKYAPQNDNNDEIEDYDEAVMPKLHDDPTKTTKVPENTVEKSANLTEVDLERRTDEHENVFLNLNSRYENVDYITSEQDIQPVIAEAPLIETSNTQSLPVVKELQLEKMDIIDKLKKLQNSNNNETPLKNSVSVDQHLKETEDLLIDEIHDDIKAPFINDHNEESIDVQDLNDPNHVEHDQANILLDFKYRSGSADMKTEETVENIITTTTSSLPTSLRVANIETSEASGKTIDDYRNELSSNAYVYHPTEIYKREKKPINSNYQTEIKVAPVYYAIKENLNNIESKIPRRGNDNVFSNHPLYLPRHLELSSADTWKTGFNLDLQDSTQPASPDQDFRTHRYDHFPSYLISKLSPDYRSSQLRLRADNPTDSVQNLVSNLNQFLASSAYLNIPSEKHSIPHSQHIYESPIHSHDLNHPRTDSENLQRNEHHHHPQWAKPLTNEHQIHQGHRIQNINHNPNTFAGMIPRFRDGRGSGWPYNLKWLSKSLL